VSGESSGETAEYRTVPPGETIVIQGRVYGAGYRYKVIKKQQPKEARDADE
jgi:hypothetical protein